MPNRRSLDPPHAAPSGLPSAHDLVGLVVPALVVAVAVAALGAVVSGLHVVAPIIAVVIAGGAAALTTTERRAAAARARAAAEIGGIDLLTGTTDATGWETALDFALSIADDRPVTVLRLALMTPRAEDDSADEHDRLLVVSAVRWQEILRPGDRLARVGAVDFAVALPNCGERGAKAIITRLQLAVPDACNASVGAAQWDGLESPAQLTARAEHELLASSQFARRDPIGEGGRVAAVRATGLANRHTYQEFDDVARSVAWLLSTPIVTLSLFDESWQHYIGIHGFPEGAPVEGLAAEDAICRSTVATGQPLVTSDAERHPVLKHVKIARTYGVTACASVPVINDEGHVLGSICAMVLERHRWTADDIALLKTAARRIAERLAEVSEQSTSLVEVEAA